jgi:ribonuclease E
MAVTDPEKLRAVQVASEPGASTTRVPRERKPLPPTPNEPLVQVETQR